MAYLFSLLSYVWGAGDDSEPHADTGLTLQPPRNASGHVRTGSGSSEGEEEAVEGEGCAKCHRRRCGFALLPPSPLPTAAGTHTDPRYDTHT